MTTSLTTRQLDDALRAGLRGGPPGFVIPQHEIAGKSAAYQDNLERYRQ